MPFYHIVPSHTKFKGNHEIELLCQDINHFYDTWQWHWDYKPQILMTNLGFITELAGVKVFLLYVIYVKVYS